MKHGELAWSTCSTAWPANKVTLLVTCLSSFLFLDFDGVELCLIKKPVIERITVAQNGPIALFKDLSILILDEATCALWMHQGFVCENELFNTRKVLTGFLSSMQMQAKSYQFVRRRQKPSAQSGRGSCDTRFKEIAEREYCMLVLKSTFEEGPVEVAVFILVEVFLHNKESAIGIYFNAVVH
ncbi:hypothetical protein L2E82_22822 [Cichorium intybus]|uniref:Uncharacterized protein n=1 Tax=Cichorium intybus TaxID=13427 RepID=A0ACB9DZ42_CICIN|nr:hypothetical protein L2E82_22822 [Cichorium intybus]